MVKLHLINTGSELMLGRVLNTHQQWICRQLADHGYVVERQVAVDDSAESIRDVVSEALNKAELIIVTGGLGPTSDDRTRDLIAELLQRPLRTDPSILAAIHGFFAARKRQPPASVNVQALVPEGATVLPNANGTAPGLVVAGEPINAGTCARMLVMLPGPPRELRPMFTDQVLPLIESRFPNTEAFVCRTLRTTGMGESFLEEAIVAPLKDLTAKGLELGYCARIGEVDLRLTARGGQAAILVQEGEAIARRVLGPIVFGSDDEQLEQLIVRLLTERKQTLAVAESCTGGYIANRVTNVPGASAVFLAGLVTYSNTAKQEILGVSEVTLQKEGAVSEAVAAEMANGVKQKLRSDYAISVTGIAGPRGGTDEKPVGTVYIGFADSSGTSVRRFRNAYDRETFKYVTSQQALEMLRRAILKT